MVARREQRKKYVGFCRFDDGGLRVEKECESILGLLLSLVGCWGLLTAAMPNANVVVVAKSSITPSPTAERGPVERRMETMVRGG